MVQIRFERLVSRGVARILSNELDIAGVKMSVNDILGVIIIGAVFLLVFVSFILLAFKLSFLIAAVGGMVIAGLYIAIIYMFLEFKIDSRKTKLEEMLPDYLQITAANLRSGIALDRAMLLAARPEFGFLSEDIKEMTRRVFGGENFETSLRTFASRYRSYQLNHAVRMMLEALRFGGAMTDLLEQISKDIRNQQMIQKEVSGQLFMYSIFIAFAGLIAAPALYGLTGQMIVVTNTVWKGILASNPNGLPTVGVSFLKPSPPKIGADTYHNFSIAAIIIITAFASLIMAAISSGSAVKGLKYMPVFIAIGLIIFFIVANVVASLFTTIGSGA